MAKVTWNGEDGGSDSTSMKGYTFKKGEAVDVDDKDLVKKLQGNQYFTVTGADDSSAKPDVAKPPSQQSAQHPVEKPGEPKNLAEGPTPLQGKK